MRALSTREQRAWYICLILLSGIECLTSGCARLHHYNQSNFIEDHIRASRDKKRMEWFKASILVPGRDIITLETLWRHLAGNEAWNAASPGISDSSFYTNRTAAELTPARVATGPCQDPAPQPPFTIKKLKTSGATPGFIGTDADGRRFLFKLDHPDYPELGTSAAIIGSRIMWALGYNVPPIYLVEITGTGDARFDGQRATAALFLDDVAGHFHFDWFRHRRELRGLRLACAWINDTDRVGSNTLVVVKDGRAKYYLIDFNSCLGSWQGVPKESWRGWRHQGSVGWALLEFLSFSLAHPEPDPVQPAVSPAVGRFTADHFSPLLWRSQMPNTPFQYMSGADRRWIISKIRDLKQEHLEAIIAAARLSRPEDTRYLLDTLMQRQRRILGPDGKSR
ncbi:MAG: hypothetical protein ABIG44_08715 [Planctomycetota bacterium]